MDEILNEIADYIVAIKQPESGPDAVLYNDGRVEVRRESNKIVVEGLPWKDVFIYA